jgi:hypothetical protein
MYNKKANVGMQQAKKDLATCQPALFPALMDIVCDYTLCVCKCHPQNGTPVLGCDNNVCWLDGCESKICNGCAISCKQCNKSVCTVHILKCTCKALVCGLCAELCFHCYAWKCSLCMVTGRSMCRRCNLEFHCGDDCEDETFKT